MTTKPNEKPEPQETRPPEPEFFDSPDMDPKSSKRLLANPAIKIGALAAVCVVVFFIFVYTRSNKKSGDHQMAKDEKRALVTTTAMERAIDASTNGKKQPVQAREDSQLKKDKRKYNTAMAVLVPRPEKSAEIQSRSSLKREDFALGLPSGTKIPAFVSNRVFSFNIEAPVTAVVAKDVTVKDQVVIPKNAQFLGQADVIKSVDRINVRFDLLVLPDGRELKLRALALSEDGSAGIKGRVDKHTDRKVLKAIGETLLAGASLFAGARQSDPYSLEDQMRMNLTQNLTTEASRDLRSTKIETSITVEAGTAIQVILLEAV
jgi:type IV secretory pathway VirB10-like protein